MNHYSYKTLSLEGKSKRKKIEINECNEFGKRHGHHQYQYFNDHHDDDNDENEDNVVVRRECKQSGKCNSIWINHPFILITLIALIGGNCSVIGTPAKLDSTDHMADKTSKSAKYTVLPDYILSLNDPDISGPVDYVFVLDTDSSKVIAWDLLPPLIESTDHTAKSMYNHRPMNGDASAGLNHSAQEATRTIQSNTKHSTTKTDTITTRGATSPSTNQLGSTQTTPVSILSTLSTIHDELLKLPGGNSKVLPSWLSGLDDPDVDAAVPYEIPEDLNSYNPVVITELLPPLEPYTDLSETSFTTASSSNLKTEKPFVTTTFVTRSPTIKTTTTAYKLHWSQTKPYTTTTTASPKTLMTNIKTLQNSPPSISSLHTGSHSAGSLHVTTKSYNNQNNPSTITSIITTTPKITTTSTIRPKTVSSSTNRTTNTRPAATRHDNTQKTQSAVSSTIAPELDGNPFEPTIPPWLKDFNDPDVGPGVPYVYDPTSDDDSSDHTAVASETKSQRVIPSAVLHDQTKTKKPFLSADSNIAVPISTLQQPIDHHYESFPPYFNVTTSYDVPLIPTKPAYSKTNNGNFLGTNQLTNGGVSAPGFSTTQLNVTPNSAKTTPRVFNGFSTSPGILTSLGSNGLSKVNRPITTRGRPYENMHKILGKFGAPPGILTPYDNSNKG